MRLKWAILQPFSLSKTRIRWIGVNLRESLLATQIRLALARSAASAFSSPSASLTSLAAMLCS
jgi:hypothetical protein